MRRFNAQVAPEDIRSHYTPRPLAKYCLGLTPIAEGHTVHDAAKGDGAFFDQFPVSKTLRSYSEIAEGRDFLSREEPSDWIVTNPPYHVFWKYVEKSATLARVGFGFLISSNPMLSLTPKRLSWLKSQGFGITTIAVVNVREWFGRYYYVVFQRNHESILKWSEEKFSTETPPSGTRSLPLRPGKEKS